MDKLLIKFLNDRSRQLGVPKVAYEGDAGIDIFVCLPEGQDELVIHPNERLNIPSGISITPSPGYWSRIAARSSTERRLRLRVVDAVIDQGYTGELFTQVVNHNTWPITIRHGDRIAQVIFHKSRVPKVIEVVDELPASDRSAKGFGSSGK